MDVRNPGTTHLVGGAVDLRTPGSATNTVAGLKKEALLAY